MPYIALDPTAAQIAPVIGAGAPLVDTGATLGSMRTELIQSLGNRTDIPSSRIDFWINQGYLDLASSLKIETLFGSFMLNTVAGQPLYRLPTAVASTRMVSVIDETSYPTYKGRRLDKSDLSEYRNARDLTEAPRGYFRDGNLLVIYPTPDKAYALAVDFKIRPTKLTADNHSPVLPEEWHEAIILSALEKGYRRLMEFEKALAIQNELVGFVRRKQDEMAEEDTGRVIQSSLPSRYSDIFRSLTPQQLREDGSL